MQSLWKKNASVFSGIETARSGHRHAYHLDAQNYRPIYPVHG